MTKHLLIPFFIFSSLANICFSQDASDDEKLRRIISDKGQVIVTIPNPGWQEITRLSRALSIRSVSAKRVILVLSPLTVDWFISERYEYQIEETFDGKGVTHSADISGAMEWESYPSFDQYDSIMRFFAAGYPSLCTLDTIGTSIMGRLILALKISDNCNVDESEPEVFYTSTIHGDETAGFILMLRLADYLLKNYHLNTRIKNLVDNLEIWINPLANPDGTYRNGNFIVSPVRSNANGFDLNRNFPDPLAPATLQEKETLDMMSFMESRRFVLSANFHSGEEVVNYPWDRWSKSHADEGWFYNVSREWADTAHIYSRKGYMDFLDNGVTNGYDWYSIYGGRQDYVTYTLYGREITVELDTNYITPSADLGDIWEYNHRSLLGYIENSLFGVQGKITDALSDKPVHAMVFINGHDKDNSHSYSDSLTGFFTRLLAPGLYDLTFIANGYKDTIIRNVNVISREAKNLNVKIIPELNPPDTTDPAHPLFYPNPGETFIKVVLPEHIRGMVNIRIFNQAGMKVSDYDTEASDIYPLQIDVTNLPAGTYFVVFKNVATEKSSSGKIIVVNRF
jgi:hypothetical protein